MPKHPNIKLRQLAQEYLRSSSYTDAYKKTFPDNVKRQKRSSTNRAASRVMKNRIVQEEIRRIMDKKQRNAEAVIDKLWQHLENKNPEVSLKAAKLLGDYFKLFVQRVELAAPDLYKTIMAELIEPKDDDKVNTTNDQQG